MIICLPIAREHKADYHLRHTDTEVIIVRPPAIRCDCIWLSVESEAESRFRIFLQNATSHPSSCFFSICLDVSPRRDGVKGHLSSSSVIFSIYSIIIHRTPLYLLANSAHSPPNLPRSREPLRLHYITHEPRLSINAWRDGSRAAIFQLFH